MTPELITAFLLGAGATFPLWLVATALAEWSRRAERRTRTPETDTAGRIELVDMSMEETR